MQNLLRPNKISEFIGQQKIKQSLKLMTKSSIKRKKQMEHILFYGPPGLGKTTLAKIVSQLLERNIKFAQGPLLEKKSDIISLFASLVEGEIIFIDEIHGIKKNLFELLFSTMEDGVMDILVGPEGDQRIMRMKLPKFTLIGATTKRNLIPQPLQDRFGYIAKLKNYSNEEIQQILKINSNKLKIKLSDENCNFIAQYSSNTPRIANNLLKRIRDYMVVNEKEQITNNMIKKIFQKIGLFYLGINEHQMEYLNILYNDFKNK